MELHFLQVIFGSALKLHRVPEGESWEQEVVILVYPEFETLGSDGLRQELSAKVAAGLTRVTGTRGQWVTGQVCDGTQAPAAPCTLSFTSFLENCS